VSGKKDRQRQTKSNIYKSREKKKGKEEGQKTIDKKNKNENENKKMYVGIRRSIYK